jgi:hypothetical protein
MTESERWWFTNRENQARRTFDYGKAQNTYERNLAKTQAGWDRSDLLRQFSQQRAALPSTYNRRGVMNSGLWQRGYGEWAGNKVRSLTRQQSAADSRQQGFDIADYSMADIKQKALDDLTAQRIAYEQTLDAAIKANKA